MIVKLEPYEIEMATQVANKRYVENIKMKKTFGHGFKDTEEKTLSLGIIGAMGEVAYCKGKNVFFNGSYTDTYNRYDKADVGKDIEIRTHQRKQNNTLIIRPIEKKGRYVLITYDGNHTYTIQGWFPYFTKLDDKYLTDFGLDRPKCWSIPIKDLYNINDL